MGSTQVEELGEIESPIALTSTLNVPRVADALLDWMLALPGNEDVRSINVVVGETNDGFLNDIRGRHVGRDECSPAAEERETGAVEEGVVGAGTGTVAFGWKGGIGTSSRKLPAKLGGWTVGVARADRTTADASPSTASRCGRRLTPQSAAAGNPPANPVANREPRTRNQERRTTNDEPRTDADGSCMIVASRSRVRARPTPMAAAISPSRSPLTRRCVSRRQRALSRERSFLRTRSPDCSNPPSTPPKKRSTTRCSKPPTRWETAARSRALPIAPLTALLKRYGR